jgi:hypothetical protein
MQAQPFEMTKNICSATIRMHKPVFGVLAARCVGGAVCGLVLGIATAGPALAGANQPRVAWGFAESGNGDCPNSCFINRGAVYVAYLGTGSYEVELEGMDPPGPDDFQVISGIGGTLAYCVTVGWSVDDQRPALTTVDVFVNCYDASGNLADTAFSFLYQSRANLFGSASKGIAFLLADQPTEASYTPNLNYQYDSTGATDTMVRNGTGSYTASLPGLTKKGGNVQVTAYGSGPARCKVSSWDSDQSGTTANVLCFDGTGAAADEMFTLAYAIGGPLGRYDSKKYICCGDIGAYASADKPDRAKTYTPPRKYNYNGFGTGGLTVQRKYVGEYAVTIPGEGELDDSAALVTANGSTNTACTAAGGGLGFSPIQVYCSDENGNPADSRFSVLLQTDMNQTDIKK